MGFYEGCKPENCQSEAHFITGERWIRKLMLLRKSGADFGSIKGYKYAADNCSENALTKSHRHSQSGNERWFTGALFFGQ